MPYVPVVSKSIARAVTEKCIDCIVCSAGDKKCYIGTFDNLDRRLSQHASDIAKNRLEKSALAHHAITNGHSFDFDSVWVLKGKKTIENQCY